MKFSLAALITACAVASYAFAFDVPPSTPPHLAAAPTALHQLA